MGSSQAAKKLGCAASQVLPLRRLHDGPSCTEADRSCAEGFDTELCLQTEDSWRLFLRAQQRAVLQSKTVEKSTLRPPHPLLHPPLC